MKVLVTAEQLRRPVPGGVGTYTRAIITALGGLSLPDVTVEGWATRPPRTGQHEARADPPTRVIALPTRFASRLATAAMGTGLLRPPRGFDVVHASSFPVPITRARHQQTSVFLHDLAWRALPEAFPSRGRRWHERSFKRLLTRADVVLVPSSATADDAHRAGVDRRSISVVPEGCDHLPLVERHDGGYVLAVSTREPRKNLGALLGAYRLLRAQLGASTPPLKLVGARGWGADVATTPDLEGVEVLGHVSDHDLAHMYAGALAFVYVPTKEGFGLPPLEAMRAGCPVISSAVPSVGGSAATGVLLVSCESEHQIARALADVTRDQAMRADLARRGRAYAEPFTWKAAAEGHVAVWTQHLEGFR